MAADQIKADPLNANDILTAEFEYIAQTAFQANEDRARRNVLLPGDARRLSRRALR